jgi:hypothetical protein
MMANGSAADVVRKVADGQLEPEEGARQLEAFFEGDIAAEAAGDPQVSRVSQLVSAIKPETTPGIITIIVTIKRC